MITNNAAHIAAQDAAEIAANIFADLEDTTIRSFSISYLLDTSRRRDFHSTPLKRLPQRHSKATTASGTSHLQLSLQPEGCLKAKKLLVDAVS
jgi:hypothetical protein